MTHMNAGAPDRSNDGWTPGGGGEAGGLRPECATSGRSLTIDQIELEQLFSANLYRSGGWTRRRSSRLLPGEIEWVKIRIIGSSVSTRPRRHTIPADAVAVPRPSLSPEIDKHPNEATAPARFGAGLRSEGTQKGKSPSPLTDALFGQCTPRLCVDGTSGEFNLTEAVFGRECLHVATTEGKRIQATQTSRRWVRRVRKSG
jgi:hypothetical protein